MLYLPLERSSILFAISPKSISEYSQDMINLFIFLWVGPLCLLPIKTGHRWITPSHSKNYGKPPHLWLSWKKDISRVHLQWNLKTGTKWGADPSRLRPPHPLCLLFFWLWKKTPSKSDVSVCTWSVCLGLSGCFSWCWKASSSFPTQSRKTP